MVVYMMREEGVSEEALQNLVRTDVGRIASAAKDLAGDGEDSVVSGSRAMAVASMESVAMAFHGHGSTREEAVIRSCDMHIEQALWLLLDMSPGGWKEVRRKTQEIMDEMEATP